MARAQDLSPPLGSPNCGACTLCCERDAVFIHPECGDDASLYETIEMAHPLTGEKGLMLKRGEDGVSCGYLERGKGCQIYNNRPAMCREFDCRGFYQTMVKKYSRKERCKLVWQGVVSKEIYARGRRLLKQSARAQ